jgi:oxygen-independent coproporphyrinogen-3 oxidase
MRLLASTDADAMRAALDHDVRCDYLYMYPPRQAYRPFAEDAPVDALVAASLHDSGPYNLYIHFPFCRQICEYCNLYAVPSRGEALHHRYVAAVEREIETVAPALQDRVVRTVYFGGGTPSMLDPALLARTLANASSTLGFNVTAVPEVAVEVAPETATHDRLMALRVAGFNRVNLGIQTADDSELRLIGRRHGHAIAGDALSTAMSIGFDNVCADLIFGLPGQTLNSWIRSVQFVIERRPDTICGYALTLRPNTGFDHRGYLEVDGSEQYRKWDILHERLVDAGYEQQTHVRWALPGRGGYLQKQYHWAGETLVGVGAGARSYLPRLDIRNGYSLRRRTVALVQYLDAIEGHRSPVTDGFLMDEDERMRKTIVLGLMRLDRADFIARFDADPREVFTNEFAILFDLGLARDDDGEVRLTTRGVRHRDVAVQPFISDRVRALTGQFAYAE